jgi:two-component system, sensor histidine kinase and response regulator
MALKMAKNLLGVIAGQASIVTILMLVLLLSIVGAPILQQKKVVAQRLGADVAVTKAFAITEAILAGDAGRESLDTYASSFSASHLQHALATSSVEQPAGTQAARAAAALRENPTRPYLSFENVAGNPHLFYGVRDRADGLLLLDLSLERERATIGRFFGQS